MDQNYHSMAVDPTQYDSTRISWNTETNDSPIRRFFRHCLEQHLEDLHGKSVLDIGSGTGYLTELYKELGAQNIVGVEPSYNSATICKRLHPEMTLFELPFEQVHFDCNFHAAISVMVFEHIGDPESVLKKIFSLLHPQGSFYLIVADKEYSMTPRFNYDVKIQGLADGEVAGMTRRPQGVMYDIFRPIESYIQHGVTAGFSFKKDVPLIPTEELKEKEPRYLQFNSTALCHLLVFKK